MRSLIKLSSFILILTILLASVSCANLTDDSANSNSSSGNGYSSEYSSDALLESSDTEGSLSTDIPSDSETSKGETESNKTDATDKENDTAKRTFTLNTTNTWRYSKDVANNVVVRTLNITTGWGGETVTIGQATDLHINYCTSNDLKDPVLYSTYQNRKWLKDGASLPNVQRCLETLKKSDLIVLSGDIYDYYSEGVALKTDEYIFNKYDNVVGCLGNHEIARQMQGTVADPLSLDERRELVASTWCNDIDYASYVVKDKVMVVLLNNSTAFFLESQYEKFKTDLEKARNNGYIVLIFYHIPIDTGNPACAKVKSCNEEYYTYLYGRTDIPNPSSTGATRKVYNLISNNGDVIKGCFVGHDHYDFYTEILAKTPSGRSTMIPQYNLAAGARDSGHVLKIVIN